MNKVLLFCEILQEGTPGEEIGTPIPSPGCSSYMLRKQDQSG